MDNENSDIQDWSILPVLSNIWIVEAVIKKNKGKNVHKMCV